MSHPTSRHALRGMVVLLASGLLVACGSNDSPDTSARKPAAANASAKKQDATAEEVAAEARGKVKCPARIKSPSRAANAPVDDIVGVRPGMTYDEAANVVLCTNALMVVTEDQRGRFQINSFGQKLRQGFGAGFAEARVTVQKTAREWAQELQYGDRNRSQQLAPGTSRWYVGTMGIPGEERVLHAAREEAFVDGRQPTVQGIVDALIAKYGPVTELNNLPNNGEVHLAWKYDPLGRHVTETSPLYRRCSVVAHFGAALSFSPDCGITVAARVLPVRENHAIANVLQVVVVDQAGAFDALQKTEQWFAMQDAHRRAREVEAAGKNAAAPTL